MTTHTISAGDRRFLAELEANRIAPARFDHRGHLRAAYIYLTLSDPEEAIARMRDTLLAFLEHHGVEASKYHETITAAWVLAVRHFMARSPGTASAEAFIDANPRLLDPGIMRTHYSTELLLSSRARAEFVEPDLGPIPRYA